MTHRSRLELSGPGASEQRDSELTSCDPSVTLDASLGDQGLRFDDCARKFGADDPI